MSRSPALGLYCPDQHMEDFLHDPNSWEQYGLLLHPTGWADGSPVVTASEFAQFITANGANDRNGNWGEVREVATDQGRVMVHITGDALACGAKVWDGMTVEDIEDQPNSDEIALWHVGEGGLYRLADEPGCWDEWAPVRLLDIE